MTIEPQIIEGFSALTMKRYLQSRVSRMTQGMTIEERLEHTRQAAIRCENEIAEIREQKQSVKEKRDSLQTAGAPVSH